MDQKQDPTLQQLDLDREQEEREAVAALETMNRLANELPAELSGDILRVEGQQYQ